MFIIKKRMLIAFASHRSMFHLPPDHIQCFSLYVYFKAIRCHKLFICTVFYTIF